MSSLNASLDMEAAQHSNSVPNFVEEKIQDLGVRKRLQMLIERDSRKFDSWSSLVADVEKICADDKDLISSVYDSFLSRFPLCHWFWTKYAYHTVRLSLDPHKAVEIFERALSSSMYSLGLWIDYCQFGLSFYEDKFAVSRLFETAILFVGKGYLSHAMWDLYLKHEHSQRNWRSVANIYLQVLRYPTEKLHKYYNNFIMFVAGMEEETQRRKMDSVEPEGVSQLIGATTFSQKEIFEVIEDLHSPSDEALRAEAVQKYKLIGDQFYQKACVLDDKIKGYEKNIRRQYFHMIPLDDDELKNWHMYLDFIDKQGDFLWALQLYERCLISCANYPEFWIRYVEFIDSKGGRELANFALERATGVFLKGVKEMHLFNATYKEQIGDASGARAAIIQFDDGSASNLTRHVIELANMERRLGNLEGAYDIYDKTISLAEDKRQWHSFSTLFIHLSRLKYTITRSAVAARDVLIDGIHRAPHCRSLLEELIKLATMHQEAIHDNLLDSIIADAISANSEASSQALDSKDREDISFLYLEFVDLCGTVDDVRKARNRHIHLFPHLVRDNKKPKLATKQDLQFESQQIETKNTSQEQEGMQQLDSQVLEHHHNELPAEDDAPKLACNSSGHNGEDKAEPMNITTSTVVDLSSQITSEPNSANEPSLIPDSFEEKPSAVSTLNHQEKTLEEIHTNLPKIISSTIQEGLDKNQTIPIPLPQGESSEIPPTNQMQPVNSTPGQSQSPQVSSPRVSSAQMPDVSQPTTHPVSNYNQAWDQTWQYHYHQYQQQQQLHLQQQYQLQVYQSMQQQQVSSPMQQNQYTAQQQLQLYGPYVSTPYQQQQYYHQHVSQQAEQQDHHQQENDPKHQKGNEQDQHAAQSYQAQWQQYQLQQQAYMLQWQQQQQLQYGYGQPAEHPLPPQQERLPVIHGGEKDEHKQHCEQGSGQDV